MLLCFRCSPEIREALDMLVASGSYADYSLAIEAAVRNQVLMEQEVATNGAIVIGDSAAPPSRRPMPRSQRPAPPPRLSQSRTSSRPS